MNVSKAKLNLYSRLGSRKQREKSGLFPVEGAKCVADTIPFFRPEALLVLESAQENVMSLGHYNVFTVSEAEMRSVSHLQTLPDIMAVYRLPEPLEFDESLASTGLTLLLDAVQDPGNLGTILRIASWFGIRQVVLGIGCADPYNPKAVQASMGAVGMVRIIYAGLEDFIDSHHNIPVYGTLLEGRDIYTTTLSKPAFIVMGNEGNGLSEAVRRRISIPLLIPCFASGPHAESLNVAAATAVTVSEFMRQNR